MEVKRANKGSGFQYSKQQREQEKFIQLDLNVYMLNIMCKMVVSENRRIRRTQLNHLNTFINLIDPAKYNNDKDKMERVSFIKKGIEARIQFNLTNKFMILNHINGGILDNSIIDLDNYDDITSSELEWLNNMISETIRHSCIYTYADTMIEACMKFKTAEPGRKSEAVREFESTISMIQNGLRKRRNESSTELMFSLREGQFEDCIYETYNELANPKRKLVTGMQGLNEMLGGGFEATRCYIFFGLPGEGKSTMLLNLAYQIKKYNKGYETKDPTKRPCIVLLTMENLVKESIERMFSVSTCENRMTDYSPEEIIKMMRSKGELRLTDDDPIDIIIVFKPSNSVDTTYLYNLVEDLEDDGMECICMIQDYIGRIRSTERYSDTRLEYGAVCDEFKNFAEEKGIPVISASQLNRDASKHIDEAKQKNKADLVRLLGRSNISESMLILNNIDGGFMLAPEVARDGSKYVGVQDIKHRYKTDGPPFIYLPFVPHTNKLTEDYFGMPSYKTTMKEDVEFNTAGPKLSPYHTNGFSGMNTLKRDENEDTIFSGQVYNSPANAAMEIRQQPVFINPIVFYQSQQTLINPIIFD